MSILAIIIIAVMTSALTILYQKAKKKRIFGLEKFEKTYDAAVSAYGEDNKDVIVGTIKLTTDALAIEHVAIREAQMAYDKNVVLVAVKKERAKRIVDDAEERAAELERRAQEIRKQSAEAADALKDVAEKYGQRASKLKKMIDLM